MSRTKCNTAFWKDLGVTSRFVHLEWLSLNCLSLLFWIRDNLLHPQPSFVSLWFIITLLLGRTIHSPWSISAKSLSASLNEMFLKAGCTITRFTYSEVQVSKYWIIPLSIRSAFHLSNVHLPWFGITTLVTRHSGCLKKSSQFVIQSQVEPKPIVIHSHTFSWHALTLKGHCHAIWQLYKKLEGVFASIEFQN